MEANRPRDEAPDMTFYRPAVKAGGVVLRLPSVAVEPHATFEPRFQGRVVIGEADRFADMPSVDEQSQQILQRVENGPCLSGAGMSRRYSDAPPGCVSSTRNRQTSSRSCRCAAHRSRGVSCIFGSR